MLFTSGNINQLVLKNRWIMLAMHTGFAVENRLTEREFAFYEERAKHGASAITLVMGVNSSGALKNMLNGKTMENMDSVKELANRLHAYDCKLFVQLFHCGRNESKDGHSDRELIAPSRVMSSIFKNMPKEMNEEEINETIEDFAFVAKRCTDAGVDAVEINCSVGYLLSEFLSPVTNLRKDEYGGNSLKRIKFPFDVLTKVRDTVGKNYPIIIKISGAQMMNDGYCINDMIDFVQTLEKEGLIDAVTVTGGWHESPVEQISYHVPKGGYSFLIDSIKRAVSIPVIGCNRINDKKTAESLLNFGICDFCGAARGFLCDEKFVEKMERNIPISGCQGCNKCIQGVLKGEEIMCAYHPEVGKEYIENTHRKIATKKKVLVIGGGPGGLYAAKKAAERGYETTIFCKESKIGGQLNLAQLPPKKQDIALFVSSLKFQLEELSVNICYDTEATAKNIIEFAPYFVVVATGSVPVKPDIFGVNRENVFMASEVFEADGITLAKIKKGSTVILGGSSLGLEIAGLLCEKAYNSIESDFFMKSSFSQQLDKVFVPLDLQILEKSPCLGMELGSMSRPVIEELKNLGVKMMTKANVIEIYDGYVLIDSTDGEKQEDVKQEQIKADNVIIAMGSKPTKNEFIKKLEDERISYAIIGDASCVGDVKMAIYDAYDLFLRLYIA